MVAAERGDWRANRLAVSRAELPRFRDQADTRKLQTPSICWMPPACSTSCCMRCRAGVSSGWCHGRLEWGPRALGHRSVLADPMAPHVLENLNGFLKRRPSYRTYGVSVPLSDLDRYFEPSGDAAPAASPFMQFEYRPRDPEKFRSVLPDGRKRCVCTRWTTANRASCAC